MYYRDMDLYTRIKKDLLRMECGETLQFGKYKVVKQSSDMYNLFGIGTQDINVSRKEAALIILCY